MKRLAAGILTGTMVLSLGAMTASATEVSLTDTQMPSNVMTKRDNTEKGDFSHRTSKDELINSKSVLRGENVDMEAMMEEKLALRGENVDMEAMMEEKLALRGENVDMEAMMEEKLTLRGENVDMQAMMEEKLALRGEGFSRDGMTLKREVQ